MKKHLIAILSLVLVIALIVTGIWLVVRKNNSKTLLKASTEFITSEDTSTLLARMETAENSYKGTNPGRLPILYDVISKFDEFEKDITSYLVLSNAKASSTSKLSKTYKNLTSKRDVLLTNYSEYITRMNVPVIDGNAVNLLYNEIFNLTMKYIYEYNSCFVKTCDYVFDKVYKVDTIKRPAYKLYSIGVTNLLNNISNNLFRSDDINVFYCLFEGIKLNENHTITINTASGGEYCANAMNFKKYFAKSNLSTLIDNFSTYYHLNLAQATSNEMLAVYYARLSLNLDLKEVA